MRFLSLILSFFVAAAGYGVGQVTIFPVDSMQRGLQITQMVATLNAAPYVTSQSEVAVQILSTAPLAYAPHIIQGVIPYVQTVTPAPNDTLLILKYLPRGTSFPQYIVVPVEQIVAVVYSIYNIPQTGFTSNFANGIFPLLSVDPVKRAVDIQSIVTTLSTSAPYNTVFSTVGMQTTLSGPFYPTIVGGLISRVLNVQMLSATNSLLLVTFQPTLSTTGTVVVAAEQVTNVIYYPNN